MKCSLFKAPLAGLFIFLTAFTPVSTAQDVPRAAAASADSDTKIEQDVNGALYMDFKGASLINVLNSLSEISKINFVAGNEIAAREINMSLDGVTLQQALEAIARGSNVTYDYMPDSNVILFRASSDSPTLAPLITRVFKLYFLRASVIREINAGQSSSGGSGSGSSSSGVSLISSGNSSSSSSSSSSGSSGEENSTEDVPILKIIEKMLSERGTVSVDDRSNSIIVTDTEDRLDRVAAVIAELDRPLNQVLINVLLVETFEDLDRELGIEWANTTGANGIFGTYTGGMNATSFPFDLSENGEILKRALGTPEGLPATGDEVLGTRDFRSLNVQVRALQTASKLKILAKPNILVMDNHPAIIKIVTNASIGEVAVVAGNGGGGDSGTTTTQQERAEVGTILRVTPQINTQEQITMTIEPTFATVNESTITAGTGDPTVRAARTTLMVNSGATMVMGGLMFSQHSDGDRKVPVLGDIPVLGRLFLSEDKAIEDRELVLFLTPQIIKNPLALQTNKVPSRRTTFTDEAAQFWKYKKKSWYKDMKEGKPQPDNFDQYFQVRSNAMDQAAGDLQKEKETVMNKEVNQVDPGSETRWEVR